MATHRESQTGLQFSQHTLPEVVRRMPLTFQVLRRSHATRNQKTPKDTQAHLGHKTLSMTLETYAQVIPDSVREMVERDERETLAAKPPAQK